MDKNCRVCFKTKPITDFQHKNGKATNRCSACYAKYQKSYYDKNREKQRERVRQYKLAHPNKARAAKYGLTVEQLSAMLESPCQLCGQAQARVIDHDHFSGEVRGAICSKCNTGLGHLGDSEEGLQKAIEYLRAYRSRLISEGL